jgi:hypothetical protein
MAATQSPYQITAQQQAQQAALTALLVRALAGLWPLIGLGDLHGSLPRYKAAVAALVYKYGQSSAALAAGYYQAVRTAAGVPGRFVPTPADPAGIRQVDAAVGWATRGLWVVQPPPGAVEGARSLTDGVAQKMVVDTGRNTLLDAIEADRRCRGWVREARPGACYFCALLSTRGAVYKTEQTAGFEPHDNCHCVPVPLFADHYEPPAHVRQWIADYRSLAHVNGSKNMQLAWRRAYEGRAEPAPTPTPVAAH